LEYEKSDPKTYYNRGNTYLAMGEVELAHEDYDVAIELDPKNSKFYHSKGLAY